MVVNKLHDLEGRLIKLENKSKENFFEIEKRFAGLETTPEDVPAKINERFQELEDLLLLLQVEYTKLREKPPEKAEAKAIAPVAMPTTIPTNIEERLAKLEGDIKTTPTIQVPESLEEIETKINELESRIKAGIEIPKDILAAVKTVDMQSKRILSVEESIEKLKDAMQKSGKFSKKDIQEYIDKMSAVKREMGNEYDKLKTMKDDFERLTKQREDLIEKVGEAEVNVEKADALLARMKAVEEKIDADVERVGDMKSDVDSKIKNNIREVGFIRKELENKIQTVEEKFKSRFDKLDSMRDSLDTKILSLEGRIEESNKLRRSIADVSALKKNLDEEISRRGLIEKSMEEIDEKILSIEKDISRTMALKHGFDKEFVKMDILEKRFDDVENKLLGFEKKLVGSKELHDIRKDLKLIQEQRRAADEESALRLSLDKSLQDINNKIAIINRNMQEMDTLKRSVEEEDAERIAIEKRLQDIQARLEQPYRGIEEKFEGELNAKTREFSSKIDELRLKMELEGKELSKVLDLDEMKKIKDEIFEQKKTMQNLEKRLESAAKKYFAENLEGFAKALDRRIPSVVTRNEFELGMKELSQRLQMAAPVGSPDLSHLSARVGFLEKRINEIYEMMKDFSNRIPVIVE